MAFDEPQKLEKQMMGANEIIVTTDVSEKLLEKILGGVRFIREVRMERKGENLVTAHITSDHRDIYEVSCGIFFAFADEKAPILEMSLKKANLEDIFLELTDAAPESAAETKEEKEDNQ